MMEAVHQFQKRSMLLRFSKERRRPQQALHLTSSDESLRPEPSAFRSRSELVLVAGRNVTSAAT